MCNEKTLEEKKKSSAWKNIKMSKKMREIHADKLNWTLKIEDKKL